MIDLERERQRQRQREKQAPCWEPDVGLNPQALGSRPEPKADTQPLSHPGVLILFIYLFERREEERKSMNRTGGEGKMEGRSRHPAEQGAD